MNKISVQSEIDHAKRTDLYAKKVEQIYLLATREAAKIGVSISSVDSKIPFEFKDYPQTKARIDKLIAGLYANTAMVINEATREEWLEACLMNDKLVGVFADKVELTAEQLAKYQARNLDALAAFQKRKAKGLNLSDRVWKYSKQFKGDIEMGLDVGLAEGKSAAELSRDLRQYLQEPDKLFHRVRDKNKDLVPSKSMKDYFVSRQSGGYASSYKNAMRLTRTEINMAYRASDYESNQQLDFVVGIEVKRSNHVFGCDVCESLKGKYPKDFKFTGWHPQCRCYTLSVLATVDEFVQMQNGDNVNPKDTVKDLPEGFKKWVNENADNIDHATKKGKLPYFLEDNRWSIKESM